MAGPQKKKLADALEALEALQSRGIVAIRSSNLSRTHRERLLKHGFLQCVMKGWYIPTRPEEQAGESTAWYASFWDFCAAYLNDRFGTEWSLSPDQSLFLHTGNRTVPRQLLVRAPRGGNKPTELPHGTSLFDVRAAMPAPEYREQLQGLRVYSLPAALVFSGPSVFVENPTEARTALAMIPDASDVLAVLLQGGHTTIAGRLAGAFRNVGRDKIADQIISTMRDTESDVRENDPFDQPAPLTVSAREPSSHVMRMRLMWHKMREQIISRFPAAPTRAIDITAYLKQVDDVYVTDAYHSLSIEGYQVTPALIERVRIGAWDPVYNEEDREHRNALAARGYYEAFQSVKKCVQKVLRQGNPGTIAANDHATWYRQLFAPSVAAGIVKVSDLAGYRNGPVFIRRSLHVPPSREAVRDMMPLLFELLTEEEHPGVRAVLGHFIFVYIHPYMDGNGRMGRFLMNVMMAAGRYQWTVIPVERRNEYMQSLDAASVGQDIRPFTDFLASLVRDNLEGKLGPDIPKQ